MLAYSFYESDNRVRRYAETLVRDGYDVDAIVLREQGHPRYEVLNGVNVLRIQRRVRDEKNKLAYLFKLLGFFINSALVITRENFRRRYDLVHVHSIPDFEVFATAVAKMMGAKIVLDIHDIVPEFYASKFGVSQQSFVFKTLAWIERVSIGFADHVIISNHIWEKTIIARSVTRDKCSTKLNYPDTSIFYKRPRLKKDDKFVVMYPGTINWHQGLDIAVRAFELIRKDVPNAELHIYGNGRMRGELQQLISELGLEDRVFLLGTLPSRQMAEVMANADLGVVPKRNDSFGGDAFSTKILEFMALGVPVVVSATRVDRHYFNDSVVRFFEPENVGELAVAVKELAIAKDVRERLASSAMGFVADYTWDKKEKDYLSLIDRLVGKETV